MMSKGLLSGSPLFYVNQQVRYGKGIFQGESGIAKISQINLAKRGRGKPEGSYLQAIDAELKECGYLTNDDYVLELLDEPDHNNSTSL